MFNLAGVAAVASVFRVGSAAGTIASIAAVTTACDGVGSTNGIDETAGVFSLTGGTTCTDSYILTACAEGDATTYYTYAIISNSAIQCLCKYALLINGKCAAKPSGCTETLTSDCTLAQIQTTCGANTFYAALTHSTTGAIRCICDEASGAVLRFDGQACFSAK